jgi:hypothetical protein
MHDGSSGMALRIQSGIMRHRGFFRDEEHKSFNLVAWDSTISGQQLTLYDISENVSTSLAFNSESDNKEDSRFALELSCSTVFFAHMCSDCA